MAMNKNKVTFKENDGLYLDGVKLEALKSYSLEGRATKGGTSQATLKIELLVDDLEIFKRPQYDNLYVGDNVVEITKDGIKTTAKNINLDGNVRNTNQEKTDDSKVYVENGMIGTKVDPMLLDIFRAIDELSSRLDALDSKINLKADSKELDELIKDIH